MYKLFVYFALAFGALVAFAGTQSMSPSSEGNYVANDFHFRSGEILPQLKLHYTTYGSPRRDADGRVTNAVMVMPAPPDRASQFTSPQVCRRPVWSGGNCWIVASRLAGWGWSGQSSKPSDGMRAHFPRYDYDDMVASEHQLLVDGLKVEPPAIADGDVDWMHARLDMGRDYADFMDALMSAGLPSGADCGAQPRSSAQDGDRCNSHGARRRTTVCPKPRRRDEDRTRYPAGMGGSPLQIEKPDSPEGCGRRLPGGTLRFPHAICVYDANDFLYAFDASRD